MSERLDAIYAEERAGVDELVKERVRTRLEHALEGAREESRKAQEFVGEIERELEEVQPKEEVVEASTEEAQG